ncbi:unnamed protein product [Rotaria socialis]|uniref:Uncharacterized protein n=1 Tax=Rotaria socialis TaxID=392032 RepID=A0A820Y546_9BILA|nr:unnamed protein product [Rotaria socialis]CAF4542666.1 unnamed protein product [Rotaria socialis]
MLRVKSCVSHAVDELDESVFDNGDDRMSLPKKSFHQMTHLPFGKASPPASAAPPGLTKPSTLALARVLSAITVASLLPISSDIITKL